MSRLTNTSLHKNHPIMDNVNVNMRTKQKPNPSGKKLTRSRWNINVSRAVRARPADAQKCQRHHIRATRMNRQHLHEWHLSIFSYLRHVLATFSALTRGQGSTQLHHLLHVAGKEPTSEYLKAASAYLTDDLFGSLTRLTQGPRGQTSTNAFLEYMHVFETGGLSQKWAFFNEGDIMRHYD